MAAFSEHVARQARKAPLVLTLQPAAFADTWSDKPNEPVMVGLRLLSEEDMLAAQSEASKMADRRHPGMTQYDDVWIDAYNASLMHWAIAAGTCHPDNIHEPYWDMAFDTVPRVLSREGTSTLFDALERLKVGESPLVPEIEVGEVEDLCAAVRNDNSWAALPKGDRRALRRLLKHVLDRLRS